MHTVFTARSNPPQIPPTPSPTHPINKHSGPEDTIYRSGASIKQRVSSRTAWMKGGSSGFPDNVTFQADLRPTSMSGEFSPIHQAAQTSLVQDGNRVPSFKYQKHTRSTERQCKGSLLEGATGSQWPSVHCSQLGSKNGAIRSVVIRRRTCSLIKTHPNQLWWVSSGADTLCRPERWCWSSQTPTSCSFSRSTHRRYYYLFKCNVSILNAGL